MFILSWKSVNNDINHFLWILAPLFALIYPASRSLDFSLLLLIGLLLFNWLLCLVLFEVLLLVLIIISSYILFFIRVISLEKFWFMLSTLELTYKSLSSNSFLRFLICSCIVFWLLSKCLTQSWKSLYFLLKLA